MEDIILKKAIDIIEKYREHDTAPKIAVFGPPESGKTDFLQRLIKFCEVTAFYQIIPLHIDLRNAPISSENALYKYIFETLLRETVKRQIPLEKKDFPVKFDIAFDKLIEQVLMQTESYVTLFIDHIDAVSFKRAEGIVHRFHLFSDKIATDNKYKRLGLCVAGTKSLFELRSSLHSAFVSYDIIRFPRQNKNVQKELINEQMKSKSFVKQKINQFSNKLVELTGGEPAFLQPLLNYIKSHKIELQDLEEAINHLFKQDISVFRHLSIRVWSDPNLQQIIKDLFERKLVLQRGNNPDIDENQLTGAVVLASPNDSHSEKMYYQFRNKLTEKFLADLLKYLDNGLLPEQEMAFTGHIKELENINAKCEKSINLPDFFKYMEYAWKELTDFNIHPEDLSIKCYVANRENDFIWRISTKPTLTIDDIEEFQSIEKNKIKEIVIDWKTDFDNWSLKQHTFFHWTEDIVTFTYTLKPFENFLFLISILVPTNKTSNEFTEFSLGHWMRFIQNHRSNIIKLTLAEFGKFSLKKKSLTESKQQENNNSSTIDILSTNKTHAVLYWSDKREKFLITPSAFIFLEGKSPDDEIISFNKECQEIFVNNFDSAVLKEQLSKKTRHLYVELREYIKNFDQLCKLNEQDQLCIESDLKGLSIPFELLPCYSNEYLSTRIAVSRRLRFENRRQLFHSPFHHEFAKLKFRNETFRVLIIGNDDSGRLDEVMTEIEIVRRELEAAQTKVSVSFNDSIEEIELKLREEKFHLLHFCGDAKYFPADENRSGLRIPSTEDATEIISYGRFAQAVKAAGLWMIYLSCCHGAVTDRPEIGQTYLNCIEALVKADIPNIVGFRWAIEDRRAMRFASEFYKQLFRENSVKDINLAMLETRKNLWNAPMYPDVVAASILITQTN